MALLNLYKLEKLKIHVHRDKWRRRIRVGFFEVMFNPETYSLEYENAFSKEQGLNTSMLRSKYALSKPSTLSLKIILDGTGVSEDRLNSFAKNKDVYTQVQKFLELTAHMDGKSHEPNYLTILWGKLNFKCRLSKVEVTYTLFDKSGIPLRAELDSVFVEDLEETERLKKENKSSPDLTHKRVVQASDTLLLLCEEIYGSPAYYLKVAMVNKLDNFRQLVPGQELFFPPIKK